MALRLTDISFTYGAGTTYAQSALDRVSLEVGVGELVLVAGATGSGKSTLLRIAAGLLQHTGGSASIDDVPLDRESARGAVGLVFQDAEAQLFAESVIEDVAFGPRNLGATPDVAETAARRALEAVGLDPARFAERSPFALSGGEARRAAIAGVLAMAPRYLLLDEPGAGLDAAGRAAVRGIVSAARREAGVVVVTHAPEEFLGDADRVVVLSCGRPAFSGTASELIAAPDAFGEAGLAAPDVLRLQMLARERGAFRAEYTLDPLAAAQGLSAEGGWS